MGNMIVDTYKLDQYAQRIAAVNKRVNKLEQRIELLYLNTRLLELRNLIQLGTLDYYSNRLVLCQAYLQETAADIASVEKFLNQQDPLNFTEPKTDNTDYQTNKNGQKSLWSWGDTWDVVEKMGPIGAGISAIGGAVTADSVVKGVLKAGEGAASTTEKVATAVANKTSFNWKNLLGLDKVTKKSFSQTVADELDEYNIANKTGAASKTAVVAKWVGTGLTAATTAYENFTDEENTVGRAIAETVGETAVKVAAGVACKWVATGIVTGIAAAVGAPAIATTLAVGVVAVGVSWAADKICESITGKNVAEFVSDTVIDGAVKAVKTVGDAVKNVAQSVGSTAKKVVGKVGSWLKKLF